MRFKPVSMASLTTLATGLVLTSTAWAHDGHGLTGAHWHASDAWGFVMAAAVLSALAVWLGKRDK